MDREFEIKLILEVESHKCLYDKTSVDYKDRYKKTRSWEEISLVLNKSVAECQRKWTNLRDSFRAYLKAESFAPSGSAPVKSVKWVHFEALKFLVPFIKTPSTISNFSSGENSFIMEQTIDVNDIVQDDMAENCNATSRSSSRAKRARDCGKQDDKGLNKILKAIENEPVTSAIETFFQSLAKQSEGLTRKQQLILQKNCLQALEDVETNVSD